MQNLSNKPLFAAIIFTVVCAAMIFGVVLPLVFSIKNFGLQIAQQQTAIANDERRIRDARAFGQFEKQHKADLEALGGILVDGQMPLDLINSLEIAAKNTNVKIDFSPTMAQQPEKDDWPSITMEAEVSGAVTDILQFIKKIDNIPYLLSIRSIGIRANMSADSAVQNQTANSDNLGKAHILLKAYAKK
jgi:hypothetical protein